MPDFRTLMLFDPQSWDHTDLVGLKRPVTAKTTLNIFIIKCFLGSDEKIS